MPFLRGEIKNTSRFWQMVMKLFNLFIFWKGLTIKVIRGFFITLKLIFAEGTANEFIVYSITITKILLENENINFAHLTLNLHFLEYNV